MPPLPPTHKNMGPMYAWMRDENCKEAWSPSCEASTMLRREPDLPIRIMPSGAVRVQVPQSMGHTAYNHVGMDVDGMWRVASVAAVGLAAYHGYRRNNSIGWAVGWALLAGLAPVITVGVAVAQGFGKRKGR